jgi:hypothetical protein
MIVCEAGGRPRAGADAGGAQCVYKRSVTKRGLGPETRPGAGRQQRWSVQARYELRNACVRATWQLANTLAPLQGAATPALRVRGPMPPPTR